ncbi:MAG: hypothetical protein ABFD54_17360 [Armatimonadota bacterium]
MHSLYKIKYLLSQIVLAAIVALTAISIPIYAQAQATSRTTPVEVKNPISIDQSGNTVNAQQSGTWSVGIAGIPSVNVSNTPGVIITNTPNVNLINSPTVQIDAKYNSVKTATQSSAMKLWNENIFVAPSGDIWSNNIYCKGYKEARIVIKLGPYSNDLAKVYVNVYVFTPDGFRTFLGKIVFSSPTVKSISQGDLEYGTDSCIFTVPVMSDNMIIQIFNGDVKQLPIYSRDTWVYLVN